MTCELPVVLEWILMEKSNDSDNLFGHSEKYEGESVSPQVPCFFTHEASKHQLSLTPGY